MKILSNKKYNGIIGINNKLNGEVQRLTNMVEHRNKDILDLKRVNDDFAKVIDKFALEINSLKKELKITKAKLTRAKKGNK